MRISSARTPLWSSMEKIDEVSWGFHSLRAISIAWDVFSSSVRRTVALLVSPAAVAASSEDL